MSGKSSFISQAGVLAYRRRKQKIEFLLVTSRGTGRWVLPKGMVDPGRTPTEAAAIEAWEEAGVKGDVSSASIGTYVYKKIDLKGGAHCQVEVFPMEIKAVLDDWPERRVRERLWVSGRVASRLVDEKRLRKLIRAFAEDLETRK